MLFGQSDNGRENTTMKDIFESLTEQSEKSQQFRFNQAKKSIQEALKWVGPDDFVQLADECIYQLVAENAMLDHHTEIHYETL